MSTELENVQKAVAEFDKVSAGIAALRSQYEGVVYDVTNPQGLRDAKEARRAIAQPRIEIEKIRKAAKAPILELGRKLDGEAKRITEELLAIETPITEQIQAEEAKIEAARQAKIKAEQDRVAAHQSAIAAMRALAQAFTSAADPGAIAEQVGRLEGGLGRDYEEFSEEAERAREAALIALRAAHIDAMERQERQKKEAEERAAEQERLRQAREEFESAREEQNRVNRIQELIGGLRGPMHLTAVAGAFLIKQEIAKLNGAPIDDRYAEFKDQAARVKSEGLDRLCALLSAAEAAEAERAQLEAQRKEQAERQAEIERREAEQEQERLLRELREKGEREQRELEERQQRETEEKMKRLRERIDNLGAGEIVGIVAAALQADVRMVAARLAQISVTEYQSIAQEKAA